MVGSEQDYELEGVIKVANLLDRYQQGECKQVWDELDTQGAAVSAEPLLTETLAVAHESMRRVKHNLDLLIPRLHQLGYQFGEGFTWGLNEQEAAELTQQAPIISAPAGDVDHRIADLEAIVGKLPLSLQAFYREVGSVNLVGKLPAWEKLQPEGIENIEQFVREHPDFNWSNYSLDHGLDPLFVWSIDMAIVMAKELTSMAEAVEDDLTPYPFPIAPDYYSKYGKGGSGPYIVELPCLSADAPLLREWHHTTFVNYLRISLQWGGMPGLARAEQLPEEHISYLTEGFLPI